MRKEVMMKAMSTEPRNVVTVMMMMIMTVTEQANVVAVTLMRLTMQTIDILAVTVKYLAAMKINFCSLT